MRLLDWCFGGDYMNIVIAPDSFKGSLSAMDICEMIESEIKLDHPQVNCIKLPLADGGDGTLDVLLHSTKGRKLTCSVSDPLGRTIEASYGEIDEQSVFIEMAQASGLPLLEVHERNPLQASTRGTGEMIVHAMESGYRNIYVGLGGSATNDGGVGMLEALGIYLRSEQGERLPALVTSLQQAATIDDSERHPLLDETTFFMVSDVDHILCGPQGASYIFGPQKGADAAMVEQLDRWLQSFGKLLSSKYRYEQLAQQAGTGAAGGLGATMLAVLKAQRKKGIEFVLEALQADNAFRDADLIITGEGKLDQQTLGGKVIAGVSERAQKYNKPVIALCGSIQLTMEELKQLGLLSAFSIVRQPCTLEDAVNHSEELLRWQIQQIIRTFMHSNAMKG